MKITCLLIAGMSLSLFMFHNISADENPRVFTNEDLSRHKAPDSRDSEDKRLPGRLQAKSKPLNHKTSGDKEKEKWCKKGRLYQNRVDEAKAYLHEAEKTHSESLSKTRVSRKGKKRSEPSDARSRKARLRLERAEKRLLDIEQEAHRKNIPPGWLRCQFSY